MRRHFTKTLHVDLGQQSRIRENIKVITLAHKTPGGD